MLKLAYQEWTTEEGKAHNETLNATRKQYEEGTMQMRTVGIRNRAKIGQWPGKTD